MRTNRTPAEWRNWRLAQRRIAEELKNAVPLPDRDSPPPWSVENWTLALSSKTPRRPAFFTAIVQCQICLIGINAGTLRCLMVIAMRGPDNFHQVQIQRCNSLAERASDETDREFWVGLAHRWQELLETGRYGGPTPQDDLHNPRRKIYTKRWRDAKPAKELR